MFFVLLSAILTGYQCLHRKLAASLPAYVLAAMNALDTKVPSAILHVVDLTVNLIWLVYIPLLSGGFLF